METITKILDKKLYNNDINIIDNITSFIIPCEECNTIITNHGLHKTCENNHIHDGKDISINKCDVCYMENKCLKCGDVYCGDCLEDRGELSSCDKCGNTYCDDCVSDGAMYWCEECSELKCCEKVYKIQAGNDRFSYIFKCDGCIQVLRGECCS
jgi:hypothetical protein